MWLGLDRASSLQLVTMRYGAQRWTYNGGHNACEVKTGTKGAASAAGVLWEPEELLELMCVCGQSGALSSAHVRGGSMSRLVLYLCTATLIEQKLLGKPQKTAAAVVAHH